MVPAGQEPVLPDAVLSGRTAVDDPGDLPVTAAPWRRRLVIFAKAPRLGRVKTRLGRDIGHAVEGELAAIWLLA